MSLQAVAQHLSDAAAELAAANKQPLGIRIIDEQMDALVGESDLPRVLESLHRIALKRVRRDAREGWTSRAAWQEAADALDCIAADLSGLDYVGEQVTEEPPCRGCRVGSEVCTC